MKSRLTALVAIPLSMVVLMSGCIENLYEDDSITTTTTIPSDVLENAQIIGSFPFGCVDSSILLATKLRNLIGTYLQEKYIICLHNALEIGLINQELALTNESGVPCSYGSMRIVRELKDLGCNATIVCGNYLDEGHTWVLLGYRGSVIPIEGTTGQTIPNIIYNEDYSNLHRCNWDYVYPNHEWDKIS